jgi:hypothetical protein
MIKSAVTEKRKALLLSVSLFALCGGAAEAADVGPSSAAYPGMYSPASVADTTSPLISAPSQTGGLAVNGWLIYPRVSFGAVYDDNVYQSSVVKRGEWGFSLRPQFDALLDTGKNKLRAYGLLDARIFPWTSRATTVSGAAGLENSYEINRDLIWNFNFGYARSTDISSSTNVLLAPAVINFPTTTNQFNVGTSLVDSFNWGFVKVGGGYSYTFYENTTNSLGAAVINSGRDGEVWSTYTRLGYNIGPALAAYVEPSYNWRRFNNSFFDSDGYRVVAGLQSDRISLFRGDIYAGYQQQFFNSPALGTQGGGVVGAKLSWFPTRLLTVGLSVDETIGESTIPAVGAPIGSATKNTTLASIVTYDMWRNLTATAKGSYSFIRYVNATRRDDQWTLGAALDYYWTRNWGLRVSYDHTEIDSNFALASFSKNVYMLGATYRY